MPRAVTVDGFAGKQLEFTVPAYDKAACRDGTYALVQADNAGTNITMGGAPNLWAERPNQPDEDVDPRRRRHRLVIVTIYPRAGERCNPSLGALVQPLAGRHLASAQAGQSDG